MDRPKNNFPIFRPGWLAAELAKPQLFRHRLGLRKLSHQPPPLNCGSSTSAGPRVIEICRRRSTGRLAAAVLGISLGIAGLSLPVSAADAPPTRSWAELMAEGRQLRRELRPLKAAGKTDEVMVVAEKLNEADRRLIEFPATDAAQKKYQDACRQELLGGLQWLVKQHRDRQAWSAAARLQQELADLCAATYGKASYRAVDERNEQAYLARLAALQPEEAGQLAKAEETAAKVVGLYRRGRSAEAIPLAREVLDVRRRFLGDASPFVARSADALAMLYHTQGDFARAEPLYLRALAIRKRVPGENHPDYATSLNNLAMLYHRQGDDARAEPLVEQALEITQKTLGENHPDYATGLSNLALMYEAQGDYAESGRLLARALEIRKRVLTENHPDYADSLGNLGAMYDRQGDYARAEPLMRQACKILVKALGENHPRFAAALNNLAEIYRSQGDYDRAETLHLKAIEIRRQALGVDHPDYAASLNNLAELYWERRDYARAESLFRQAAEIVKNALGENHPNFAKSLGNLAGVYREQGDYAQAEPLYRKANEIIELALGEDHPERAIGLNNLALLYQTQGDYARAEPLLRQAADINKKALGEHHPEYARSLNNLAVLYRDQGDFGRAETLLRQAISIQRSHVEAAAVAQSERQQLAMLASLRFYLDNYLALTAGQDEFSASTYAEMLAWKGIVSRRQRLIRAGEQTPELRAVFRKLQQVAGQLANQAWAAPDPKLVARWQKNIERLSAEKERLEAELSDRSADYHQARRQITLESLQQALPKEAVLVDILQYEHSSPADKKAATKRSFEERFVAFVVCHDGPVTRIDLGPAEALSAAIDAWRETFGASPPAAAAGKLLRERIWAPIETRIRDARIVLVSPDGALCRLPFAALPGRTSHTFLLEERTIAIVPVAQMIPEIMQAKDSQPLPGNLLLVGNIDYDAEPGRAELARADAPEPKPVPPAGSMHFEPLPKTRDEVAAIEKLYRQERGEKGVLSLQTTAAVKKAVLAAAGKYRYLHLATHGFFLEEKLPPALASRRSGRLGEMLQGSQTVAMNPGLLCGLALTGANRTTKQQPSPPAPLPGGEGSQEADDQGVVTAEEIAAQNFDGVELVTLSACETGLGKSSAGEGLLGLQRSFQSAGRGAWSPACGAWTTPPPGR